MRMKQDRKKPGVAFWLTMVVVVLPVLYVVSFGPASWICLQGATPDWYKSAFGLAYAPLLDILAGGPPFLATALLRYLGHWI